MYKLHVQFLIGLYVSDLPSSVLFQVTMMILFYYFFTVWVIRKVLIHLQSEQFRITKAETPLGYAAAVCGADNAAVMSPPADAVASHKPSKTYGTILLEECPQRRSKRGLE